jgi:tetratricopeptide (TPR) repeat protein
MDHTKSVLVTVPHIQLSGETSSLLEQAKQALEANKWQEAEVIYQDLAQLLASRQDSILLTEVYCALGIVSEFKGRYDCAVSYYKKAVKLAHRNDLAKPEALLHTNLGHIFYDENRWEDAWAHYQQALNLLRKISDDPGLQRSVLESLLDIGAARALTLKVLEKTEQDSSPEKAVTNLRSRAHILISMEEWQEAEGYLRLAIQRSKELDGWDVTAILQNDLAYVLKQQGRIQEAQLCYEAAILCSDEIDDQKTLAITHNNIGLLMKEREEFDQALDHFLRSLELKKQSGKMETSNTLFNLASTYYLLKQLNTAEEYIGQAIEVDRERDEAQFEQDLELLGKIQKAKRIDD